MFRHAAEQHVLPSGLAVFTHDNQIGFQQFRFFPDDSRRRAKFDNVGQRAGSPPPNAEMNCCIARSACACASAR